MTSYRLLLFTLAAVAAPYLNAQTCPAINLQSTPRIVAGDKQVVVAWRETDGSFSGYFGPRIAPFLIGSEVPNLQNMITSCYPPPGKKGPATFSFKRPDGWSSYIGDYADLDGDGVQDAVLIAYKPNVVYEILMAASNVPKAGYPKQIILPNSPSPKSLRVVDVNNDGKADLLVSVGDTPGFSAGIYVLLNNGDGTFGSPRLYPAGSNPSSFTVIDINGDKIPDLVVANPGAADGTGGGVVYLLGNGMGGFSSASNLPTGNTPAQSVVVDDFNGDGKLDIAAATGATISLFLGNGSGSFAPRVTFPSGGDSVYLVKGDFNGDGKMDLASSNFNEQTASVLINTGASAGGFQPPVSYMISRGRIPDFLVVTDFNNDGIPDLIGGLGSPYVIAGNSDNMLDVLLGNGDGTFAAPPVTQVSNANPIAFAVAGDFNGDGKMDVAAMAQKSTSLLFYAGRGDGTFAAPVTTALGTLYANAIGAVPADFDSNGVTDLAILTTTGFAIALGQKSGTFQPMSTTYMSATSISNITVGDFNGDGKLDIATPFLCSTNGGQTPVHIYTGNGAGSFTDSQPLQVNYCPTSLVGIDVNGDGKVDLISLNNDSPAAGAYSSVDIFLNQGQGVFGKARGYGLDPSGRVIMTIVDVNGDKKPDIVAASFLNKPYSISTLLNNGDGTFGNRVATLIDAPPLALIGADLNKDNKADLILAPNVGGSQATNDLMFMVGTGDGHFQTPVHVAAPNTTGLQFADFNNDGLPDLLAASAGVSPYGYFTTILTGAPSAPPPPVVSAVNGASFTAGAPIAPDSIATVFGSNLAVTTNLTATTVSVKDSAGTSRTSATLFYVSPVQVNFQVPPGTVAGMATLTVTSGDGTVTTGTIQIANVAPGLFSNAGGLYAGSILRVKADGTQTAENNYQLDAGQNVIPLPVNLGSDQIFLILYGTGIKGAAKVTATVGNQTVPVAFAGAQGAFVGEDQVNIGPLPLSLAGSGKANIVITADGIAANTVNLTIQ